MSSPSAPPKCEVLDRFDRRRSYSSVVMPNGSIVCVSHDAPLELLLSLYLAVMGLYKEAAA